MSHDLRSDLVDAGHSHNAPAPTLHDEMLAALRAAESYLAAQVPSPRSSRQMVLRMVQAAVMRAEREGKA